MMVLAPRPTAEGQPTISVSNSAEAAAAALANLRKVWCAYQPFADAILREGRIAQRDRRDPSANGYSADLLDVHRWKNYKEGERD